RHVLEGAPAAPFLTDRARFAPLGGGLSPFAVVRPILSPYHNSGPQLVQSQGRTSASPHVAGVAALWAERQLKRNGVVNLGSLDAQVRAQARRERLPSATYLDVGEGLATAPLD